MRLTLHCRALSRASSGIAATRPAHANHPASAATRILHGCVTLFFLTSQLSPRNKSEVKYGTPHNANEQSCLAEIIITLANQWISSEINVLAIEDRGFQFLAAKTNPSSQRRQLARRGKVLVVIEQTRWLSREGKEANPVRRIILSQRNAVLVFLLVFGLYEGQVLAQAVRENYTTTGRRCVAIWVRHEVSGRYDATHGDQHEHRQPRRLLAQS